MFIYSYQFLHWLSMYIHARGGICGWGSQRKRKSVQRATATEWSQCNLSILSCFLSCSKLWSVSIDQRKNLLPLTFDSSIDHFLLYTVKGKYSDSTQGLGRSPIIPVIVLLISSRPFSQYRLLPHLQIKKKVQNVAFSGRAVDVNNIRTLILRI